MTVRLREAETQAELKEVKQRVMETETQVRTQNGLNSYERFEHYKLESRSNYQSCYGTNSEIHLSRVLVFSLNSIFSVTIHFPITVV